MGPSLTAALNIGALHEENSLHEKKRGVFYTPPALAAYLVRRTLGEFLKTATVETARQLRILDPSCGCGIFLLHALEELLAFYARFPDEKTPSACEIIETQIYGVDLDPKAIELTHQALRRFLEAPQMIFPNIVSGNALETADSDFRWREAFSDVTQWDFILGNPPYVTETRSHSEIFRQIREHSKVLQYYCAKMDLADAFTFLSLDLLRPGGQLAFVLPEYWTQRESARSLREKIFAEGKIREFWTFGDTPVFDRAKGHHTSLVVFEKNQSICTDIQPVRLGQTYPVSEKHLKNGGIFLEPKSRKCLYGSDVEMKLLARLCELPKFFVSDEIQQGIVLPQPEAFIVSKDIAKAMKLTRQEQELLKPFYETKTMQQVTGFQQDVHDWMIYTDLTGKKLLESDDPAYDRLRRHLDGFSTTITSSNKPYGLHRSRQPEWFESPEKIFCLRQAKRPTFAIIPYPAYVNEGIYVLKPSAHSLETCTAILNSRLAHFWFLKFKHKGSRLQVDKDVLCGFPAPPYKPETINSDQDVYRLYGLSSTETDVVEAALAR